MPRQDASGRAAKAVTNLRQEIERQERRRTAVLAGAVGGVVLVLVAAVTIVLVAERDRRPAAAATRSGGDVSGVTTTTVPSRNHTAADVRYPQSPPVGGDHAPVWTNCGVYTEPVNDEQSVHSLEHGAVWVTYRPDLPAAQVRTLTTLVGGTAYGLLSPYAQLPSPVVASAWGVQLRLDSADDPRLAQFLGTYLQGPQTPEPGAVCTGGIGGMP